MSYITLGGLYFNVSVDAARLFDLFWSVENMTPIRHSQNPDSPNTLDKLYLKEFVRNSYSNKRLHPINGHII